MDDCDRPEEDEREKERGSDMSHSFIPCIIHSQTRMLWISFLPCCFYCMFMFCSRVKA